jgi:hypothetical protein
MSLVDTLHSSRLLSFPEYCDNRRAVIPTGEEWRNLLLLRHKSRFLYSARFPASRLILLRSK